jgi:hypothetical protein
MLMSSRRGATVLFVCALLAACKKDDPPAAPSKPAAKKVVEPKAIAKKDAKPGPAANGKNVAIELAAIPDKPVQEDRGHFELDYRGADSETRAMVRASGVFEKMLPQLDASLRLPHGIKVVFDKCDEVNAFYDPEQASITMCDEYLDYYGELFSEYPAEDAKNAIIGSVVSTFLHETGHALIDQLELPMVGREEDAADQLSTVILVASGDEGNAMAIEGAYSFIAESEAGQDDDEETPFWDEHSLDEQRFYNSICLIYGSDPDGWDDLVGEDDLPEERAERCPDEYALISSSWNRLLEPYMTVPAVKVNLPGEPAPAAEE